MAPDRRRPRGGPANADACMKGFIPLREEAEKRGKMIKAAGERKAPPDEACKLIRNFGAAEIKMIKYIEANAAKCGIPPQIGEQMKQGHVNTEKIRGVFGLQRRPAGSGPEACRPCASATCSARRRLCPRCRPGRAAAPSIR